MWDTILTTDSPLLILPVYGPRGIHPIFPEADPDDSFTSEYLTRLLIRENHFAIALSTNAIPSDHPFIQPSYSITFTAIQLQHKPSPYLSIHENSEIWVEDGVENLRRIAVGECQGRVQDYFFFACWGCRGVQESARGHQDCAYGVIRVKHELLHPDFNKSAFPDHPFLSYRMNDCWRNIRPEFHLQLALVYPPGYAPQASIWYEYIIPIPVFATEKEVFLAKRTDLAGLSPTDDGEMRQTLLDESRLGRRVARQARNLAKNTAELCQAIYKCRTYQHMLLAGETSAMGGEVDGECENKV